MAMLIDKAEVTFKGGDGGNGKVSFRKNRKGPDGGNGGDGGNVYVIGANNLKLLNQFSRQDFFAAEDGIPGGSNQRSGRAGEDITISLPVGTSIIDKRTGHEIFEITKLEDRFLIAKGGKGGLGNWEFRSSENPAPKSAQKGKNGETKELILSLRLIADYGLIGLPNVGKSSLLNELTGAHAKTADYEFTTLSPSLGVLNGKVLADIPGLIEGAAEGKGLGTEFLKHIEKVKMLLHCISATSESPINDYKVVRDELGKFNPELTGKKEIILLTKTDLADDKGVQKSTKALSQLNKEILPVSINDWDSLEKLKKVLRK